MGMVYYAGFRVASPALSMTCTIAGNVATVPAGTYCHNGGMENALDVGNYSDFLTAVATAFDTAGGGPWTLTFNTVTLRITISRATNFALTFSSGTPSDVRLANALGFAVGTISGAASFTGTLCPYYVIATAEPAKSISVPVFYEPDGITEDATSDGGTPYGVSRQTNEMWSDWKQPMEPRIACFDIYALNAGSPAPWTWQSFMKHVRATHPFFITGDPALDDPWVFQMRADAARSKPEPVSPDWDSFYNITFHTRVRGQND